MLIPVRCFTCGRVSHKSTPSSFAPSSEIVLAFGALTRSTLLASQSPLSLAAQVIGNKYETYMQMLIDKKKPE